MRPPPPAGTLDAMNPPSLWPGRVRATAALAVAAAAVLTAAACGGSPSSTNSASTPNAGSGGTPNAGGSVGSGLLAYSRCMRSHGVADYPDPGSNGQIAKQAVASAASSVGASVFQSAGSACASLAPAGVGGPPITAQEQQDYLNAAACMRSHGITGFPDPNFSNGTVSLNIPSSIDTTSPQFNQARQTCERLIPAGLPFSDNGSGG
jgi:hypothetical protein